MKKSARRELSIDMAMDTFVSKNNQTTLLAYYLHAQNRYRTAQNRNDYIL